jgi:alanine-glyoxylate transaminase/serine-glyoxylate transaminase/serine-pyruvate transaminase
VVDAELGLGWTGSLRQTRAFWAKQNPTVATVRVPEGVDEAAVRGRLLSEYSIEIAGGLGDLKGRIWRIGLMGHSSREENVLLLLAALRRILHGS